jgi:ATP-dependent Lon protease
MTPEILPVLPLRSGVLLPYAVMPVSVGRAQSEKAVEAALATEEKRILVVGMKNPDAVPFGPDDLHQVGTIGIINQMQRVPSPLIQLILTGDERAVVDAYVEKDGFLEARARKWPLDVEPTTELEGLARAVVGLAERAAHLTDPSAQIDIGSLLGRDAELPKVVYFLASAFSFKSERLEEILEAKSARAALEILERLLSHEIAVLEIRNKITSRTASELSEEQRRHILHQQLRAIREELGERDPEEAEVEALEERVLEAGLPDHVASDVERELERLRRLPAASQEHHVIRDRIELIIDLPWSETTAGEIDLDRARAILDQDHHDLEEVKERILEHLAVLRLKPDARAPILCFVGPPGVGKTSVGQSIARALGRKFERMSLGGVHDEAELRGHRRTYVGAMPGRIIRALRNVGARDPVLMLDEVDKLGRDFRGDPAAALLEILDPEQHDTFHDNYLDLPFDLSKVFFITTANLLDTIPKPLLDRMEILRLPGYTDEDKLVIANRFLIPRQIERSGLTKEQLALDEAVLRELIGRYTREAGVRQLEQRIGSLARKIAVGVARGEEAVGIDVERTRTLLGPAPYARERWRETLPPGVAPGLAWTEAGGDVLYVEAATLPEARGLVLTGQLGDVMKESAQAALSYLWSRAGALGLDRERLEHSGIHVHVPAGATPKDGPSAGITIAAAIASLIRGVPVRADTAMTGEATLAGLVLPVGGIREKVLAASRLGIRRVILPEGNEGALAELPDDVRRSIEIILAGSIDQVLDAALCRLDLAA